MTLDLEQMSRNELLELRNNVNKAIKQAENRDRKSAIQAANAAASEFGFSLDELTGKPRKGPGGTISAPRYQNPDDVNKTWTGKGRKPNWFTAALERGITPTDMEIG